MDILALVLMLVGIAAALAICAGDPLAWARREWRLMRAHTWAPPDPEKPAGASAKKGRAAKRAVKLLRRQQALAREMREDGRHLFAGKAYRPELTAPVGPPATPPKADKIVRPNFRKQG